jgi:adenylate cyclase
MRPLSCPPAPPPASTRQRHSPRADAVVSAHAGIANADDFGLQWLLVPKESAPAMRSEALAESEEALRREPDLAEAHLARANVLSLLGRADEADQSFRRATALAPGLRDAWYYYGRFLFSKRRYPDAARAFEEAARLNPDDYEALNLASMPYDKLHQPAKARDTMKRAIVAADIALRNNPDDVRALYLATSRSSRACRRKRILPPVERAAAARQSRAQRASGAASEACDARRGSIESRAR